MKIGIEAYLEPSPKFAMDYFFENNKRLEAIN